MTSATSEDGQHLQEIRFEVRGRVQGVGFRWWTKTQALRLGITGTVRNREDGAVEVNARGEEDSLRRFREVLRRGAPASEVLSLDESPARGVSRSGFDIVH